MIVFIILAAVLIAVGVALVAVPLLRPVPSQLAPAPWTALLSTGVLVIGAAVLYPLLTNWSWRQSPGLDSPGSMVERLVHKLNDHPDDLNGWLMLGRSYVVLQEYPLAVRAYKRADRVAGGRSAEALVGEGEALATQDESQLSGRAGHLFERALALAPHSPKALFFGAAAALHRGEMPLARERFAALLALNLPENVRPLIEQQITAIDQELAGGAGSPSGASIVSGDPVGSPRHADRK